MDGEERTLAWCRCLAFHSVKHDWDRSTRQRVVRHEASVIVKGLIIKRVTWNAKEPPCSGMNPRVLHAQMHNHHFIDNPRYFTANCSVNMNIRSTIISFAYPTFFSDIFNNDFSFHYIYIKLLCTACQFSFFLKNPALKVNRKIRSRYATFPCHIF